MAGYADDWSMSNNAIDAYDRGLRPRSKWGKADILHALDRQTHPQDRPSPSTRSFADPGSTRKAVYANAPTAPTSALMRPTSAPRGTAQIFQEIERRMNGGGANGAKAGAQPVDDYYANKVRHHLQNKLRMTDADPAPVTAWAEAVGRASKAEKRVLERRNIEHHGVLVDGDGTICGYTESVPSVDELGRVTWDSYTLTPETCTAAGVPPTRRVSVGRGYWFSHPNLAGGKTLAHVTFPEVGLGSARDEQGRIKR